MRTTAGPGTDDLWLRLLVVRCQAGDEAAFRELYGLFSGRTRRFAEALLDRESAKDVQQEVWITVYRRIAQLADPGALRTWLYMTTRHAAIDLLRRRKRESELVALHAQESEAASVQDDERSAMLNSEVIRSAVTRLPAAQREVVMLRYWEDLSYAEIAIVIGCSIGTVRSRLHYARRALVNLLTHQESIEGEIHECHP